ncbi:hypothetical protein L596_020405 [Steinernema carpocapsae]|uniref:Uncharacterized protein n=1 Tax=Steinernema carpocapsae TaxID=34508 RepID=A0A4U5MTF7_STECR|nr:hypothetical protein L596_020405 [Steinernema carpocapsae]
MRLTELTSLHNKRKKLLKQLQIDSPISKSDVAVDLYRSGVNSSGSSSPVFFYSQPEMAKTESPRLTETENRNQNRHLCSVDALRKGQIRRQPFT